MTSDPGDGSAADPKDSDPVEPLLALVLADPDGDENADPDHPDDDFFAFLEGQDHGDDGNGDIAGQVAEFLDGSGDEGGSEDDFPSFFDSDSEKADDKSDSGHGGGDGGDAGGGGGDAGGGGHGCRCFSFPTQTILWL